MNITGSLRNIEIIDLSNKDQKINKDIQGKIDQDSKNISSSNETLDIKIEAIINPTLEESAKKVNDSFTKHGSQPKFNAAKLFNVMDNELTSINKNISEYNPSIKSTDWDFTYKNDKLQVIGKTLSENDKKFIQEKLDKSVVMNEAVKQYNQSVVDYYQVAKDDYFLGHGSKHGGISSSKVYVHVQDQINTGILPYKKLMQETINSYGKVIVPDKYSAAITAPEDYLTASIDTYA